MWVTGLSISFPPPSKRFWYSILIIKTSPVRKKVPSKHIKYSQGKVNTICQVKKKMSNDEKPTSHESYLKLKLGYILTLTLAKSIFSLLIMAKCISL